MGTDGYMSLRENQRRLAEISAEVAITPAGCAIFGDVVVMLTIELGARNLIRHSEALACQLNPMEGSQ